MTMGTEIQAYWLIFNMISMNCMAVSCLSFNVFVIYLSWILNVVNRGKIQQSVCILLMMFLIKSGHHTLCHSQCIANYLILVAVNFTKIYTNLCMFTVYKYLIRIVDILEYRVLTATAS